MTARSRPTGAVLGILAAILAVPMTAAASAMSPPPKGDAVDFETLAIVSGTTGINVAPAAILRLASDADVEAAGDLLAHGRDATMADAVVASIDTVAPGTVVLVGVIDVSCTPADEAGLVRGADGELVMYAPRHVPEPIECFVANVTVGVLSVAAADAPPGSADGAELVHFGFAGYEGEPGGAVDVTADPSALAEILPADAETPTWPPPAHGTRRLAFVGAGCRFASAELWITSAAVAAHFDHADPQGEIACDQAEYYLAVFDVADDDLPPNAELAGSIVT
jgi:hypothetical protein